MSKTHRELISKVYKDSRAIFLFCHCQHCFCPHVAARWPLQLQIIFPQPHPNTGKQFFLLHLLALWKDRSLSQKSPSRIPVRSIPNKFLECRKCALRANAKCGLESVQVGRLVYHLDFSSLQTARGKSRSAADTESSGQRQPRGRWETGIEAGPEKQRELKMRRLLVRLPKPQTSSGFVGGFCKHDIIETME